MDYSTPGSSVLHCLPEFAQIHVHWVSDAISSHLILCHPFSYCTSVFPSIRVFSSESALHIRWQRYGASTSATILPMNIRGWFPLELASWISLQSMGLSRVFSSTSLKAPLCLHCVHPSTVYVVFSMCVCVVSKFPSSYKDTSHWIGWHWSSQIQDDLIWIWVIYKESISKNSHRHLGLELEHIFLEDSTLSTRDSYLNSYWLGACKH